MTTRCGQTTDAFGGARKPWRPRAHPSWTWSPTAVATQVFQTRVSGSCSCAGDSADTVGSRGSSGRRPAKLAAARWRVVGRERWLGCAGSRTSCHPADRPPTARGNAGGAWIPRASWSNASSPNPPAPRNNWSQASIAPPRDREDSEDRGETSIGANGPWRAAPPAQPASPPTLHLAPGGSRSPPGGCHAPAVT